jgi:DNA-binding transcriptional ArsR family regulator
MADEELQNRVAALETAVAALGAALRSASGRGGTSAGPGAAPDAEVFWIVEGLRRREPDGVVAFAGDVPLPTGERYRWQWQRPVPDLLAADWSETTATLAALAHPVRMRLLRRVLAGAGTAAELADDAELGTSGQLYHHLRQLVSAGWLRSAGRGRYAVPAERVVPLLVILMGAQR